MIEVQHLVKQFAGVRAVDDMSFQVRSGEILGFLGPNGAGKSTTMKMITGFLTPDAGTITVCGHNLADQVLAAQRLIGYLPEGAPCYEEMTPLSFLDFIASIRGFRGAEKRRRIDHVVHDMSLAGVSGQMIETLSKGFKRRVGLAQAILHDPEVLILDEPTDGLDPNQKHQVREMIRGLSREKIVIISTHILEEVTAVCSRAMIIDRGRIVADCTPAELEARSSYHQAVTLEMELGSDQQAALAALPGVRKIEVNSAESRITLLPHPGQTLLASVNALLDQNEWPVTSLYVEKGRLDEVFRSITQGDR